MKKKNNSIAILFKHQTLFFDRHINVGKGKLLGIEMVPNITNHNAALVTYNELHEKLGHPCKSVVKDTAKLYNIPLQGQATDCESCIKGKLKR